MKYVRLYRPLTESYITYRLPLYMQGASSEDLDQYVVSCLPGWEVIHYTVFNPDWNN